MQLEISNSTLRSDRLGGGWRKKQYGKRRPNFGNQKKVKEPDNGILKITIPNKRKRTQQYQFKKYLDALKIEENDSVMLRTTGKLREFSTCGVKRTISKSTERGGQSSHGRESLPLNTDRFVSRVESPTRTLQNNRSDEEMEIDKSDTAKDNNNITANNKEIKVIQDVFVENTHWSTTLNTKFTTIMLQRKGGDTLNGNKNKQNATHTRGRPRNTAARRFVSGKRKSYDPGARLFWNSLH